MKKGNLCLILIVLFCSFSVILKSDEVIIEPNEQIQDSAANNKFNEENKNFFSINISYDLFNILFSLVVGGIIGFYFKRLHIKHAQFLQRFDKTKELFANIVAQIINHTEKEFIQITENKINTDAEILILCSYLSNRKAKKFIRLYRQYQKQADNKDIDAKTIDKLLCFH